MKEEGRFFTRAASGRELPQTILTGIGREAAQAAIARVLTSNQPTAVISAGYAGGLDPRLPTCTVLVEADPGFPFYQQLIGAGAKPGQFHCADRVILTAAEKSQLRGRTGADAVEMESHWLHQFCKRRSVPCATVRVILDTADESLPLDFNILSGPGGKLSSRKLALALAKSPQRIPALIRLGRRAREASRSLGQVLERAF